MGVYSEGEEPFRYVAGGESYEGKILNHSTDMTLYDNFIDVDIDSATADKLPGRYVYIENDGERNAIYQITDAKPIDGGVRLYTGTVSLIRALKDRLDVDGGYIYNVAVGQKVKIPMAFIENL